MTSLWLVGGLIIAALSVSTLAAGFSVIGLGALFSGAVLAVYAMAGALEFAKFVLAAYLHQRWAKLNWLFKTYLLCATVVLSCITSMGIFGFLSDAYQSSSNLIESETVKMNSLTRQKEQFTVEIDRLLKSVEEIPANRVTKRIEARALIEPQIKELKQKAASLELQITQSNLQVLEVKKRVGPLIYISRAFDRDLDTVVKYLILVFVSVFDPLAICLVIATSEALNSRRKKEDELLPSVTSSTPLALVPDVPGMPEPSGEEVIQMRFASEASPTEASSPASPEKKETGS